MAKNNGKNNNTGSNNTGSSTGTPAVTTVTGSQIMTSEQYITMLRDRVNSTSDLISQVTLQQSQYNDQQQIYQDQLTLNESSLNYVKSLRPQIEQLISSLKVFMQYLSVRSGTLTPAQTDLPTAAISLTQVYAMSSQIAQRVYQSIQNVNVVTLSVDNAYNTLIAGTSMDPDSNNTSPYGHVSNTNPPPQDLVTSLKNCRDAGLTALEQLTNTFIQYISFLQDLAELRGFTAYLSNGFAAEITSLNGLDSRVILREKSARANEIELKGLYTKAHKNYEAASLQLANLQLDYNLLTTELQAAIASTANMP